MAIYRGAGGSGDATTDATNEASIASNAATAASTSATAAANSASSASTSATNASNSATAAATSETNAATSASAAATSYDNFDDRYLGSKSSAPSVDNDGNTLLTGALYWNSTNSTMYAWGGSSWTAITGSGGGGSGTVTSVSATVPTGLSIAGSPITSSGTLAITYTAGYSLPTTSSQTTWDTAYTDRLKWDGGSTGLTASTGRTSLGVTATGADTTYNYRANNLSDIANASTARTNLGATTLGSNLFTITNPSAITFPRYNADNTVSALDAATFRTAIGAGTSSTTGTVTSVAALTLGTTGTDLSSTVATGTTTPVITLNVPTASATNRGVLSSTDWTTFNNKGSGTVTGVTGTAPIVSSGGAAPAISITAATTSAAGSMSSADKTKLDGIATGANNYTLPTATSTANGGVELFSDTVQSVAANAVTTTASRTYGVQLNGSGQAVINVPWSDTNSGGTVTSASVVSANGFAGTVANATTTPAITLTTSITGVLKGNGTAISAATAGTDYSAGTSALTTGILKSTTSTGALSIAVSGTDYAPATSGSSILYGNGSGGFSNVTVGSGLTFSTGTLSASGGGGMTYPTGSGIAVVVSGTSWGTTLTAPSGTIVGTTDTQTLTNKRITSRTSTTTSSATPTINTDNTDQFGLTAQAVDITSFTTNLTGTPTDGQKLWIYIVGTAARAVTFGASFEASTVALPTTTVTTNRLDVGFVWNAATSKWRCVAVA